MPPRRACQTRPRNARPRALALLAVAALLAPHALRADVFWRYPKSADAVLQAAGGTCVYTTEVQINGTPGALSAFAFQSGARDVAAGLARGLGLPAAAGTGAGCVLTHVERNRLRRLIVLPSAAGQEACLVLALDQSRADAARARTEAPAWPTGLPPLDATPLFSAVSAATRTTFVTAVSAADPADAVRDAAAALTAAGWGEAAPPAPTFRLFASGRKVCVVLASRDPPTGRTTLSVLHREGSNP